MGDMMLASVGLAALNAALAVVLAAVYARNHREVRSPFTLGLLLFALFVVVHDATEVVHYVTMMPAFLGVDERILLLENGLQTGALGALVGATLR